MGPVGRATHGGCCRWAFVVVSLARYFHVAPPFSAGRRSPARIAGSRPALLGPAVAQTPSRWCT